MSRASENDVASAALPVSADDALADRMRRAFEEALLEPISIISSMATLLPEGSQADGPRQAIGSAAMQADTALRDLLEYLEYQVSGVPVVRRRVDLRLLCERVLDSIQAKYADSPIAFTCAGAIEGDWDPDRLASLLSRLVVDAMERGPTRRVLRVLLRAVGHRAVLDVCTAPSKVSEPLPRVFEPFVRSAGEHSAPTLGLSLYLAQQIARAHGGSLEALQDAIAGTTLRVTLPRF
jgi:signal transduction histidine kinase